jgi:hypothetical protein
MEILTVFNDPLCSRGISTKICSQRWIGEHAISYLISRYYEGGGKNWQQQCCCLSQSTHVGAGSTLYPSIRGLMK